jgi:cell wall-associated NlpC family hydrolase
MPRAILSIVLSDLGPDAVKLMMALSAAIVITIAFTISSLIVLLASALGTAAVPGVRPPSSPSGNQIVDLARSQLGVPYVWGGGSPGSGFDCSGLTQWVYRQSGQNLPRTAQQQFDATVRIPVSDLRPGDLLFFQHTYASSETITHVGIYVGNGLMINAPSEGDVVREAPAFSGFWGAHYAGAGRVGSQ